jgi:hypothetical protein
MTATTTERKFVLVLASRSVLRQAEQLGIDQPEIQVTDSIHAGRKRGTLPGGGKLDKAERSVVLEDGTVVVVRRGRGVFGQRKAWHIVRFVPRRSAEPRR